MKRIICSFTIVTLAIVFLAPGVLQAKPERVKATGRSVRTGKDSFGLGVILGEPTGVSGKLWTSSRNAIVGGVAWSTNSQNDFHLHVDYLFHDFRSIKVDKGRLPVYYGIGGRILFERDTRIGVRAPVGLAYMFANSPLDIFFELAPILDLAPNTDFQLNGAIGVRYFFR